MALTMIVVWIVLMAFISECILLKAGMKTRQGIKLAHKLSPIRAAFYQLGELGVAVVDFFSQFFLSFYKVLRQLFVFTAYLVLSPIFTIMGLAGLRGMEKAFNWPPESKNNQRK